MAAHATGSDTRPHACGPLFSCSLIITGAKVLGVTVEQALEAYGVYFVRYTAAQVCDRAVLAVRHRG